MNNEKLFLSETLEAKTPHGLQQARVQRGMHDKLTRRRHVTCAYATSFWGRSQRASAHALKISFTYDPPVFQRGSLKNWEWPGDEANKRSVAKRKITPLNPEGQILRTILP